MTIVRWFCTTEIHGATYLSGSDTAGDLGGDGAGSFCVLPGRGHWDLWWRVQGDGRVYRSLWSGAGDRYADCRVGHCGRGIWGVAYRVAAGGRVSVHGFYRVRIQPDRQHGCEGALSLGSSG